MFKFDVKNRIGKDIDFDKLIVNGLVNITDIDSKFWKNEDYDVINLQDLFFENLKSARGAFESCERVGEIVLIGKADKTLDMSYMFYDCVCLQKLLFLIDGDNYVMNNAFTDCAQLGHLVCYENFKSQFINKFIKNKYLNCPQLKDSDYNLYAMTVDKYKFIESLISENFEIASTNKNKWVLDIKRICYLFNEENEKMSIDEIEGVYGTGKKFIIVFEKDNINNILSGISNYVKNTYVETLNDLIMDLQFGEEIIEEMKLSYNELNEIIDFTKMTLMKMFIDNKNPIFDYLCENKTKTFLDEYKNEACYEIDNGASTKYYDCISIYEKIYKKQLIINKIENVARRPIAELKDVFSNLEWNLFEEDSNKTIDEYDVNSIVLYILDYYKVSDEFKYYNVEMSDYYRYLVEDIQIYNIIEWAHINYDKDIFSRGDLKIAEYFSYLEYEIEDLNELSKLKNHLHLYSNIKSKLINKYGLEQLRDMFCVSNSYECFKDKKMLFEYKLKKYYNNRINLHFLILLIEINGWDSNLLNGIFSSIINTNMKLFENNANIYKIKCLCDNDGIVLYKKYSNNNFDIEKCSKEFDFSYDLYFQLKSLGVNSFIDLLNLNWQWYVKGSCDLHDELYKELIEKLLNFGVDICFFKNNDSILILGLPISILNELINSNINSIQQLINLNEYELADVLHNNDDNYEFVLNRLIKFGISLKGDNN